MDFIAHIFEYQFLANALWAAILSGIICGIVGTYIVSRRLVFLSGGITHSSFGGIGIAYYLGVNPVLGALVFAVLCALGVEWASKRQQIREDSAIGIVWSVGMAIGIVFIYLTPGYGPNLMSFLFGNILTVTSLNLISLGVLTAIVILLFSVMLRPIIYVAFDRQYAKSQRIPVDCISYLMAVIIALSIVLCIRTVGIVMLISLLTMPAVIVNSLTNSYVKIMIYASLLGVAANVLGLYISYKFNVPASASAIFVLVITLIIVKLLPLWSKKRCNI